MPDERQGRLGRGFEDRRHFGTDCAEMVDVEETPVVDLVCGHMPEREPICLVGEEFFEAVEAMWVAAGPVEIPKRLLELRSYRAPPFDQRRQPRLDYLLLQLALPPLCRVGLASPWPVIYRLNDALQVHH